jgi:hypothetical protein
MSPLATIILGVILGGFYWAVLHLFSKWMKMVISIWLIVIVNVVLFSIMIMVTIYGSIFEFLDLHMVSQIACAAFLLIQSIKRMGRGDNRNGR